MCFGVGSWVVVVVEAGLKGGGGWCEGCEEGGDVQIAGRLGMAGGWSLLKATRSRQCLRESLLGVARSQAASWQPTRTTGTATRADCGNVSEGCCGIVRITDDLTGVRHLELLLLLWTRTQVTLLPVVRGRPDSIAA